MKRFPLWLVLVLCGMFVIGLAWAIVAGLVHIPSVWQWLPAITVWFAAGLWALIHGLTHRRKKSPARTLVTGNQVINQRINKETDEAVARYLGTVLHRGILKKSALYERPWFLACGAKKAGKTSLLRGAGLNFPQRYPSEKDGAPLGTIINS